MFYIDKITFNETLFIAIAEVLCNLGEQGLFTMATKICVI